MKALWQLLFAPAGESGDGGAGGTFAQAKEKIVTGARDASAKLKAATNDVTARAKERIAGAANEKKEAAAERIGGYGSAVHESARALEEKDPNIAWFAHRAADRLQSAADYMRNRDFGGLRRDAEDLARRHPVAFFGGLFVAGLILGNVVKAGRIGMNKAEGEWEPEEGGSDELAPAADTPALAGGQ